MEENRGIIDYDAFFLKYKRSIIVLMVLFIIAMPAGAVNSTIMIPNVTTPSSGMLPFPIFIGGVNNAQGLSFNLTYDKDVATVQSISPNLTIFSGSTVTYTINNSIGKTNINLFNMNGLNASNLKPIIDITFNVLGGIKNFTFLNILDPIFYFNNNPVPAEIVVNGGINRGFNSNPSDSPYVVSTMPENNSINVPISIRKINITFNEPIIPGNSTAIYNNLNLMKSDGSHDTARFLDFHNVNGNTYSIELSNSDLMSNTTYIVTVSGFRNNSYNVMTNYSFAFTTSNGSPGTPPGPPPGGYPAYDASVTGWVTSDGIPIPNASMGVTKSTMGPVNWGRANETGYYSLGAFTGEGSVFATAPGFVGRKNRTTLQQNNTINFNLILANETHGSVRGHVYSFNTSMGRYTGVENVLVEASSDYGLGIDVTNSDGSYNITGLETASSSYTLRTFARGYSSSQTTINVYNGPSNIYNFSISFGGTVSGIVTNSSGAPIADAQVNIFQPMSKDGTSTTTNATGYYTLTVAPGVYEMMVSAPAGSGLASANRRDIFVNPDMVTFIDFSLLPGVQIEGYVFNETGSPVLNVNVNIFQPFWNGFGTGTQTNDIGYYILSIPEGTYEMEVMPPQDSGLTTVHESNLNVVMGQSYVRNFTLGRSGSISGRVQFGVSGLQNANVNAWSMSGGFGWTQTDETGNYTLTGLSNGTYEVRVDPPYGSSYASMQIQGIIVITGQDTPDVNFVLSTGSSISGRVLSSNGQGIRDVSIDAMGRSGGWGWGQTDNNGNYTITGLQNGIYDVRVNPPYDSSYSNAERRDIVVEGDVTGIDFILSAAGSISGRVTNDASEGISNVNINAWSMQGGNGWAQTDINGNFTINGLRDGTYDVEAQAPQGSVYASSRTNGITVIANNITTVNFLLSGGGGITGRVTDISGAGIANANINAWSMGGMGGWGWTQTNSSGYYTLSGLQDGTYEVEVQAPWGTDYASNRTRGISVSSGNTSTFNFVLTSGGRIAGRVMNVSGAGIANSNLNAWPIGGMGGAGGWAQTNSTGYYTVSGLADGMYEVEAQAPYGSEYASNRSKGISVIAGMTTSANFILSSGGRISGRVTDNSGYGISNANVNAWSMEGGRGWTQTNSTGYYTVNGLADGSYEVEAQAPWGSDYASNRTRGITVIAGTITTFDFVLSSGGRIIGRVTDSTGNGIAYVNVNAWETGSMGGGFGWAQTDSNGNYTLNGLMDGTYEVEAQAPWGSDFASNRTKGILVSSGSTTTTNFVLGSGGFITGRVIDSLGGGIANSNINAWSTEGKGGWGWTMTDSNGYYTLRGLTDGIYEIEAQAPWGTDYASNRAKGVSVTAGTEIRLNFTLSGGGRITGRVTDIAGNGIANANLNAWSQEGGSGWAQTNSTGHYSINGLKNGVYEVEAQPPWGTDYTQNRTKGVSVTAGNITTRNFVLGSGGMVSGRVTDSTGSGIAYVNLNAWEMGGMGGGWGWTSTNSSGYYTLRGLKDGTYEVEAQAPMGTEYASNRTQGIVVSNNNITTVNFVMGSGGMISGRVTDINGAGIANSNINAWSMGGFGGGGGWATTNSTGYYTMKGLKDGTYEVEAQAPWGTEYASNRTQGIAVTAGFTTSLSFVLGSGGMISGQVTDSNGAGIANSNVNAWSIGKIGGWGWTTTNSTGYYTLKGLKASTYEVEAQTPWGTSYSSNRTRNVIVIDGTTTSNVNIVLTSGSQITGRVTADGAGVSSAFINAWSMQGGSGRAQTDQDGYYTLTGLMDGDYDVRVEPPFGSELTSNSTRIMINGADQTADFVLTGGYSITGRVIGSDGNGISYTNVNIMTKDIGGSWAWAQTDSSGYYTLRGLNNGTYDVEVMAPWGSSLASSRTRVTINGADLALDDIELSSGHSISGQVASNGTGVAYANINAWSQDGGSGWSQTNATGYYTISSLSDATYDVRVEPQYGSGLTSSSTKVTIDGSDLSGVNFELSSGHSISGQITSGGEGVSYAFVNAWSESGGWGWAQANTTGYYTLSGLGDATYEIRAEPQFGSGLAANSTTVTLAGSDRTGIDITLSGGHSISGQVTSGGTGISHAFVNVWSQSGGWGWAETDINGNYTIEGLADASYDIRSDPPYGSSLGSNSTNATINGSDITMNIILSGGYELSGRVTNTSGTPIVRARVDAWNKSQGFKGWTETDSSGNYVIKGLMSAVYEVYVTAPAGSGYSDNRTTVAITSESVTGINLTLKNRGTITGRARNSTMSALGNANVDMWNSTTGLGKSTTTDSNGNFTLRMPPGVYELKVSYSGLTSNKTSNIVVTAGIETQVGDIILSSGKSISGRVVVAPSTAASGASVVAWSASAGSGYGVTNSSGYFTISGMQDGIYNLTAIYSGITNNTATAIVSGSDVNAGNIIIPKDDGNPNYLSGTLTIASVSAPAGTLYSVTVTSGDNSGYSYIGAVDDENVPSFEYGAGKYSTPDQTGFSSGASFELTIISHAGSTTGTFSTGGNTNVNLNVEV